MGMVGVRHVGMFISKRLVPVSVGVFVLQSIVRMLVAV